FQAEDGIRDFHVTGVQTCALPICWADSAAAAAGLVERGEVDLAPANDHSAALAMATTLGPSAPVLVVHNEPGGNRAYAPLNQGRSEERRVGKEGRCRREPDR